MRVRHDLADANHDAQGYEIHARDEAPIAIEVGKHAPPEHNWDPYEDYSDRAQQIAEARDPGSAVWP